MSERNEDAQWQERWQEIVSHYGERELPDPLILEQPTQPTQPVQPGQPADDPEDHFVPPVPPPSPWPTPDRVLAWAGVLGAPLVAFAMVLLRYRPPAWAGLFLFLGFVIGLGWLVHTMPPDDGRDGWDDGAVV